MKRINFALLASVTLLFCSHSILAQNGVTVTVATESRDFPIYCSQGNVTQIFNVNVNERILKKEFRDGTVQEVKHARGIAENLLDGTSWIYIGTTNVTYDGTIEYIISRNVHTQIIGPNGKKLKSKEILITKDGEVLQYLVDPLDQCQLVD